MKQVADPIEPVRAICLACTGATEQIQWRRELVFKVGGKMFASISLNEARLGTLRVKTAAEDFRDLIEQPGICPAPYLARSHWIAIDRNTVRLRRKPVEALILRSYDLVVKKLTKAAKKELGLLETRQVEEGRARKR